MLPTTITTALHRRRAVRLLILAAGYVGGNAITVFGGYMFHIDAALTDTTMASGFVMTAGIMLGICTGELRRATRPQRDPNPSNPTTA